MNFISNNVIYKISKFKIKIGWLSSPHNFLHKQYKKQKEQLIWYRVIFLLRKRLPWLTLEKSLRRLKYLFKYQRKLQQQYHNQVAHYQKNDNIIARRFIFEECKISQLKYYFKRMRLIPRRYKYARKQFRLIKILHYTYIKFKIFKYYDRELRKYKIKILNRFIAKKLTTYRQNKLKIKYFNFVNTFVLLKSFTKIKIPFYYRNYIAKEPKLENNWFIVSHYLHSILLKFKWFRKQYLQDLKKKNFLYKRIIDFFKNSGKISKYIIKRDFLTQSFIQLRYIHFRHVSRSRYRLRKVHIAIKYLFPRILLTTSLKKLFSTLKNKKAK
jgi:hypothetical protein